MSFTIRNVIHVAGALLIAHFLSSFGPSLSHGAQESADGRSGATAGRMLGGNPGTEDTLKPDTERTIADLRSQLEQMQAAVRQQQLALGELQKRLDSLVPGAPVHNGTGPGPAESTAPGGGRTSAEGRQALPVQSSTRDSAPPGVAGWNAAHAFIRNSDGTMETQIGGYAQLDFRGYLSGSRPPNTFVVRRARLSIEGKLRRFYDFKVEGDFADPSSTLLRDFYLNVHRRDDVQFRFGQFRVPISQEEIRPDNVQDFVERSLVNTLVPSRSPGLAVTGVLARGAVEYQAGIFNGKGLLALNNNGTPESALRLRFNPWRNAGSFWTRGLIFGGAATRGRSSGGQSVRGLTESRSYTFFPTETINGPYTRSNAELTWLLGPASIRAEYDQTNQHRESLGSKGENLPGVAGKGYMAQFTYVLTGENKPEAAALAPRRSLFGSGRGDGGFGAWELKFRYSNLRISDGTAKANRAETFFFGPNWYLNSSIRYMLDFGWERFGDPARAPRKGDRDSFVILSRIQVAF